MGCKNAARRTVTGFAETGNAQSRVIHFARGSVMKSIKFALVAVLLSCTLPACKPSEPAAPAADTAPAATEPAAAPATMAPAAAAPATMPAPASAATPVSMEEEDNSEDMPQSGGDKVGTAPAP